MSRTEGDPHRRDPGRRLRYAAVTRRLYAADWRDFAAWCRDHHQAALPALPTTLAAYLTGLSATRAHGALARRSAAIAAQHRRAGHPSPSADPAVRDLLVAARRGRHDIKPAKPQRQPASPAQLTRMAARCSGDLAGLRDRALLLLSAAGLHGEHLLALEFEHVRFTGTGVTLAVAGPDPGAHQALVIGRLATSSACPVRALEAWLHSSDTRFGPVFRKVTRWGAVEHNRLRPDGLRRIWQRREQALRSSGRPNAGSA